MSLPRMSRISGSDNSSRLRPWNRIAPAILPGGSWISRRIDIAVTDLPQPDSPTMPMVWPASTWNETPSTARTTPSSVAKCVCKFSTSNSAIRLDPLGQPRVERIPQPVAQQVHRQHRDAQEDRGEEHDVWLHLPQRTAFGHDVAPARHDR